MRMRPTSGATLPRRFILTSKLRILSPLILVAVLIIAWWLAVAHSKTPYFPTPPQVVTGMVALARNGTLLRHISASLMRVTIGYLAAVLIGIPLGVFMGWFSGLFY